MKRFIHFATLALLPFAIAVQAHAQGTNGCADSPEIPTLFLGLVVGAASIGFARLRNGFGARNKQRF